MENPNKILSNLASCGVLYNFSVQVPSSEKNHRKNQRLSWQENICFASVAPRAWTYARLPMVYCLYATDTNEISHSVIQKFVIMCFLHDSQVYSYANLLRAYTRTRVKLVRFRAACRTQQTKHLFISSSKLRFPHRIGRKPVDFRYEHVLRFKQFHVNEMDTVLFFAKSHRVQNAR